MNQLHLQNLETYMKNTDEYIDEVLTDWTTPFFDDVKDHEELFDDDGNYLEKSVNSKIDAEIKYIYNELDESLQIDTGSIDDFNKERINETTGQKVKNYVDNDTFCNAVILWNAECKAALEADLPKPPMPDVIGMQMIRMAEGLSRRFNFRNYTYIDEMREDGVYMAIRAVKNFDPTKGKNAFGYFNRVLWQAFCTRIKIEKEENEGKMSLLKDPMYLGYTAETGGENQVDKDRLISIYDN